MSICSPNAGAIRAVSDDDRQLDSALHPHTTSRVHLGVSWCDCDESDSVVVASRAVRRVAYEGHGYSSVHSCANKLLLSQPRLMVPAESPVLARALPSSLPSWPEREDCSGDEIHSPPTGKYRVVQVQSRPVVSAESDPRVLRHHTLLRPCDQRRHVAVGVVASWRARCHVCWSSILACCHDRWTLVHLRASVRTLRIVRRKPFHRPVVDRQLRRAGVGGDDRRQGVESSTRTRRSSSQTT